MLWHQMGLIRLWSQLAWVVKSGEPAVRQASIRGAEADRAAFIAAMHSVSGPIADGLVARLGPPQFKHLLDVGGASGTWTLAFLRAVPGARATIFDLPDAIEQARARIAASGLATASAWCRAISTTTRCPAAPTWRGSARSPTSTPARTTASCSPRSAQALVPGGRIMIRDIVMEPDRTAPPEGALFAINMLVTTASGGTFTFDEFREDLEASGFGNVDLLVKDAWMNSVVAAGRGSSRFYQPRQRRHTGSPRCSTQVRKWLAVP